MTISNRFFPLQVTMSNSIKLLPDSLANKIAAGEVIQRPASVVKELLENSVDSEANSIKLIIGESGKSLIQVIDNGKGMSEADVRMSIERHATSKITQTEDLFKIQTLGFRGEALASMAAVSHLQIKSRPDRRDVGTDLIVEGSKVKSQDICAMEVGTTISVKHLFFNVPARRKFLKSDAVEMRHIIDEFERVALVNPDIEFKLYHNDQELFNLPQTKQRQRIVGILGKSYQEKLVPVEEETDLVKVHGFIGKPKWAKKSRGEQFFFVNGRFFKSPYFHSAILQAFEGLIAHRHHRAYFIYFEVDPESIDVNIHPTKTEIKFEDERSVFAILRSTIKRSIGQYHVAPSLDFDKGTTFDIAPPPKGTEIPKPGVMINTEYNPFESQKQTAQKEWERGSSFQRDNVQGWEKLYEGLDQSLEKEEETPSTLELENDEDQTVVRQIGLKYILVQSQEGIFLLHQYRAHVRLLFEEFEEAMTSEMSASQQQLFPVTLEYSKKEAALFSGFLAPLNRMGFEIEPFGESAFIVRAVPAACPEISIEEVMGGFLDDLKGDKPTDPDKLTDSVVKSLARQSAIKSGKELQAQEMLSLFRSLMRCKNPQYDLSGLPTFMLMNAGMLDKMFG